MLIMVVKWIEFVICHSINTYAKANSNYIKNYCENKESPYLKYWDVNILYSWGMLQK